MRREARRIVPWLAGLLALAGCGGGVHPGVLAPREPDAAIQAAVDASVDGGAPDVPTDLPTDVPADVPADLPTDLPTDVPADVPAVPIDGGCTDAGAVLDGGVALRDGGGAPDAPGGSLDAGRGAPASADLGIYRRLTNDEYDTIIRWLFNIREIVVEADGRYGPRSVSRGFDFPLDARVDDFDTGSASLQVGTAHADRYAAAAESLAVQYTAPDRIAGLVGCDLAGPGADGCYHDFIVRFGRRAFRRALRPDELADYTALAAGEPDGPSRVRVVVQAMLQSPYFLYLVEGGHADPAHGGRHRLDGYSLATRLSFAFWGTAPTDALLDQAEAGALDTDEGVAIVAWNMLRDSQAQAGLRRFYFAWLRVYRLPWIQRDPARFPDYGPTLVIGALQETSMVIDDLIGRSTANFLDLFTTRTTFLFPSLGTLYGVPEPTGPFARYTFTDADGRAGLLTQASYLLLTALSTRNSPTLRGEYVRSVLLCQPLPPPPPDVVQLPAEDSALTDRERFTMHSADPACAGCHARMDPIGFGLERFNPVGARLPAGSGTAMLTERGQLAGFDPPDFTGPIELGQRLHDSPLVPACIAQKLFEFALGRPPGDGDHADLAAMTAHFAASGYAFRQLAMALINTDAFLYREGAAEPPVDGPTVTP